MKHADRLNASTETKTLDPNFVRFKTTMAFVEVLKNIRTAVNKDAEKVGPNELAFITKLTNNSEAFVDIYASALEKAVYGEAHPASVDPEKLPKNARELLDRRKDSTNDVSKAFDQLRIPPDAGSQLAFKEFVIALYDAVSTDGVGKAVAKELFPSSPALPDHS